MTNEVERLGGKFLSISDSASNNDTLTATICICDFSTNKNGVRLNRETIDNWVGTIINKPVVGGLRVKPNGEIDFTSHNVRKVKVLDDKGNSRTEYEFDTNAFGTFTEVSIAEVNGVECVVAKCEIWKRFRNACQTILRRSQNGTLFSSWEIDVTASHSELENGRTIRVVDAGTFIGHAFLGEEVEPAYDCSRLLQCASRENPETVWAAIIRDFLFSSDDNARHEENDNNDLIVDGGENVNEEMKNIAEDVIEQPADQGTGIDTPEETSEDLSNADTEGRDSGDADNEVLTRADARVQELETRIAELTDVVTRQVMEITELTEIRTRYEVIVTEREEAARAAKADELSQYIARSGCFTDEEISAEPIASLIAELRKSELKAIIADRVVERMAAQKADPPVTSSTEKADAMRVDINLVTEKNTNEVMNSFFND